MDQQQINKKIAESNICIRCYENIYDGIEFSWLACIKNNNNHKNHFKMTQLIYSLILLFGLSFIGYAQNDSNKIFENPPDSIPKIFGKGIISIPDRYEYGLSISPKYNELFFTEGNLGLMVMRKLKDGNWSKPEVANLRGTNSWEFEAFYTWDGSKLYFSSDVNDTSRLWYSTKSVNGWDSPVLLESPVNSTPVFWATVAKSGTLYYTNLANFQIYKSQLIDGQYKETQKGGLRFGIHPFISPDEDFILFNSKGDIYIAFKKVDGKWTEPIKFGNQINTLEYEETCPSLSPDAKYIFFSRYNDKNGKSDIYWVRSDAIEKIRKEIIE
ncbi:PD40 domain-containing protein [bacterium]|nr:PD40 domain-containing protein [bacterium]